MLIRTLSACVFVPLVLTMVIAGGFPLLCLVLFIVARGSWEFFSMAQRADFQPLRLPGVALSATVPLLAFFIEPGSLAPVLTGILLLVFSLSLTGGTGGYLTRFSVTAGGISYLGLLGSAPLFILHKVPLSGHDETGVLLALIFLSIWLTDALAYLAGRRFGRRRLAPGISPGKTVEGFVAGTAGGLTPVFLYRFVPFLDISHLLGLLLLVSLAGQLGDLVESGIKRDLGVKDAPPLIPGHGGVLDRFDSYLFAFPAAYLYITILHPF